MQEEDIIKILMFIRISNMQIDDVSNILQIDKNYIISILKEYNNIELCDEKNIIVSY